MAAGSGARGAASTAAAPGTPGTTLAALRSGRGDRAVVSALTAAAARTTGPAVPGRSRRSIAEAGPAGSGRATRAAGAPLTTGLCSHQRIAAVSTVCPGTTDPTPATLTASAASTLVTAGSSPRRSARAALAPGAAGRTLTALGARRDSVQPRPTGSAGTALAARTTIAGEARGPRD